MKKYTIDQSESNPVQFQSTSGERKADKDAELVFLIGQGQPENLFRVNLAQHDPKSRPIKALRAAAKSHSGYLASLLSYFSYQQEQYHEAMALVLRHKIISHISDVVPFLKRSGDRGNIIIEMAQLKLDDKHALPLFQSLSDNSLAKGVSLAVAFDNQTLWEQIKKHQPSLFNGNNLLKIIDGLLLQEEILPQDKHKPPKLFKKIWTEAPQKHRDEFCEISKNIFRKDQEKHKKIILTFLRNKIEFSEACPESKKFQSFIFSQINHMRKKEASFFLENYTPTKKYNKKIMSGKTESLIGAEGLYGF